MNSDSRNILRTQESQCVPSTSQSYREGEFVQSDPKYHESFQCSQGSSRICNESSKQQNPESGTFLQIQDYIQVNSVQWNLSQPEAKNLDIVSQNRGNSKCLSHENGHFGVSNQQSSSESSRTLDFGESQLREMRHWAENTGNIIPKTHGWRLSFQDHRQELRIQSNPPMHAFTGEFSQDKWVSRENFHFGPFGNQEINNAEITFQVLARNEHLYPENRNAKNSVFSNQYLGNEQPFNRQYQQDYTTEHSTQQKNGNQRISDDLKKTLSVQADIPGTADPGQSSHIPNSYGIQDNHLSTSRAEENLFQSNIQSGKYSLFANKSKNNSPFSKDYFKNYHLSLNRQCLQSNEPVQSFQVHHDPRMSFVDDPETFKAQTSPPKLPDQRLSEYTQSSGNRLFNPQSWAYTGGKSVADLPDTGTSYMEMNPHQAQQTASSILKNRTFEFNNAINWDESRISGNSNAPFLSSGHLAQERMTTATTSDEQNRQKLNVSPSFATTSGELVHAISPASIHHKNSETCSKTLCLESNIIPTYSEQLENLSNSYVFTNVNLYENFTSVTKDANIPQSFRNSYQENNFFPGNLNFDENSQSDALNQQSFAYSRYKSSFPTGQSVNIHPQLNSKERIFQREMSSKSFKRKKCVVQHIRTYTNERPYACTVCPKSFKFKYALKNHILCHKNGRQFKCDICPKRFNLKGDLSKHLKTHTNETLYQCTFCPHSCKRRSNLANHILIHTDESTYLCKVCQWSFPKRSYLERHMQAHKNERPNK